MNPNGSGRSPTGALVTILGSGMALSAAGGTSRKTLMGTEGRVVGEGKLGAGFEVRRRQRRPEATA